MSSTASQMPVSRLPKVDQSLIEVANSPTAILKKVEEIGLDRGNEYISNLIGIKGGFRQTKEQA